MTDNARASLFEARSQMGRVAQMAQRVIQLAKDIDPMNVQRDIIFETATALKADAERAIRNLNEAMGE